MNTTPPPRYYTGVGSRSTPQHVLVQLRAAASMLEAAGWVMRSGGANGADSAFEEGVTVPSLTTMEIYLPWPGFNGRTGAHSPAISGASWERAAEIAKETHPGWPRLSFGARKLHTRNVFQVLGADLCTPSRFVLCWTADGAQTEQERTKTTGGTGTAIVLACRMGIPVFNAAREETQRRLQAWLSGDGPPRPGQRAAP